MRAAPPGGTAVLWHDVECGSYGADLPLWRELAAAASGPVLDLGSGTGRVSLDLAEHGFDVTGLDSDPLLSAELARRARDRGLNVAVEVGDARAIEVEGWFALVIAPMQLVQIVGGLDGRAGVLASARRHLAPGGRFAAAIAAPDDALRGEYEAPPLPDVLERDGWVLSSQPLDVRLDEGGMSVDRLRRLVSPAGEISDELSSVHLDALTPEDLEEEGRAAGLRPAGRRSIPETPDHIGSTVVILDAPA